jgi:simple sugar transport system substrate-binding protein
MHSKRRIHNLAVAMVFGATLAFVGPGLSQADDATNPTVKPLHFIAVMEGPLTNSYWASINKGLQVASKQLGVTTKYLGTPANVTDPNTLRQLMLDAQAQHPSGMFITDDVPQSEDQTIKSITNSGIPVILVAEGQNDVSTTGALAFAGVNDIQNGQEAGSRLTAMGCKVVLNDTLIQGAATFSDLRTEGLQQTFKGQIVNADIPAADENDGAALTGIVKGLLLKDPSIDCTFSGGETFTPSMIAGEAGLGARTQQLYSHSGGVDVSPAIYTAIIQHMMVFSMNSQTFSEGYLPVVAMSQYLRFGQQPPSTIGTGPAVATIKNAPSLLKLTKIGIDGS